MGKRAGELSVRLLECGSGLRFLGRKLHRVQLPFGRNLSHVRFNDRVRVQTNGSETQLFSQTNALRPRIVRMGADRAGSDEGRERDIDIPVCGSEDPAKPQTRMSVSHTRCARTSMLLRLCFQDRKSPPIRVIRG